VSCLAAKRTLAHHLHGEVAPWASEEWNGKMRKRFGLAVGAIVVAMLAAACVPQPQPLQGSTDTSRSETRGPEESC